MNANRIRILYFEEKYSNDNAANFSDESNVDEYESSDDCADVEDEDDDDRCELIRTGVAHSDDLFACLMQLESLSVTRESELQKVIIKESLRNTSTNTLPYSSSTFLLLEPIANLINSSNNLINSFENDFSLVSSAI